MGLRRELIIVLMAKLKSDNYFVSTSISMLVEDFGTGKNLWLDLFGILRYQSARVPEKSKKKKVSVRYRTGSAKLCLWMWCPAEKAMGLPGSGKESSKSSSGVNLLPLILLLVCGRRDGKLPNSNIEEGMMKVRVEQDMRWELESSDNVQQVDPN